MLTSLLNYGFIVWESIEQLFNTLYVTRLRNLFGTEGDLINNIWAWLLDRFHIADITLFEFVIGTGIMTWVIIGIIKFFKELYID